MSHDLSKLAGILNKAKNIMTTVDSGNYSGGHIDGKKLVQEGLVESTPSGVTPKMNTNSNKTITNEMINNSRLPDAIKKAMIENPINVPSSPNHTFNLEDVSNLMDRPVPPPKNRPINNTNINENIQQYGNLNEDRIRSIVSEEMTKFFSGYFMKQITESIQKQTIKNLLDSGVIKRKTTIKN